MPIDPDELIQDIEAARLLHQKVQTLASWRCEKRGPAYIKCGRRVLYRRSDIAKWLGEQLREPTAA
jgi:Helix-turn-helix domain